MRYTSHQPGRPCWVELATSDLAGAKTFYAGLFGWEPRVTAEPEAGGYTLAHLGEDPVAGLGPAMDPAQPTAWTVYLASDDVDATATAIESAGGKVLAGPFDVMGSGRMGMFADPTGATFGVWQAGSMAGAGRWDEPGAVCWIELMTREPDATKEFYGRVFGWVPKANEALDFPYTEFHLDGRHFAGMMAMQGEEWPADLPAHWMIYIDVPDVDATAARTQELRGEVSVPPTDIQPGRFAVLNDPQGAVFSVLRPNRS